MSFHCRGCGSALTVPQGVDLRSFRCPYCGTVAPLAQQPPMYGHPPPGYGGSPQQPMHGPPPPQQPMYPPPQQPMHGPPPQPVWGTSEMYAGAPAAPARQPRKKTPPWLSSEAWMESLSRKGGRLIPLAMMLMMGPCMCLLTVCGGMFMAAQNAYKYGALNQHLDEYVNIGDITRETAFLSDAGPGYIRGKYVLVDIGDKHIHVWHDGDDPRLAWRPEDVQTVVWLDSSRVPALRDPRRARRQSVDEFMNQPELEVISVAVIDLKEKRVTETFKLTAQRQQARLSRVDKKELMGYLQGLPSR